MGGRSDRAKEKIDLLVATALTEEAQVVSAVMSRVAKGRSTRGHVAVYEYPRGDGTTARVATASAHQMGAVNMGMFIAPLLKDLHPHSTALVGIAAAIDTGEVALGDVPFASQVLSYDDIAVEAGSLTFRTEGFPVDPAMRRAVGALRTSLASYQPWQEECLGLIDGVIKDVSQLRPRAVSHPGKVDRPHLVVGPIAGGPFLLRDRGFSESLQEHPRERELIGARITVAAPVHPKLVSAEMESHGFMRAAHEHGVPATVIKGISDVGDQEKAKLEKETGGFYRAFACSNAVLAALHILRHVEPRNPGSRPATNPPAGKAPRSGSTRASQPSHAPQPYKVFIGRDDELARIAAALDGGGGGRVAIVALQGMAGVGKTYLAHEFYARSSGRFGGDQHVVLDPEHPGTAAAWVGVLGERMGIPAKHAEEAVVAQTLRAQRVLVHVDNVDSAESAELVAGLSRALGGVPLLVTGRYAELGTAAGSGWTRIELAPFDPEDALRLLHAELAEAGVTVPEDDLRELVRQVAGLPLALHLAAGYLRRGVTVVRFLARLRAQGLALGPRDPADHVLGDRARGVLSTSFAISRELMLGEAGSRSAGWEAALAALGWAPRVGFGRSLGAAITGLDEGSGAFDDFIEAAVALSLVQRLGREQGAASTWGVHPLLGEFLRAGTERAEVDARIGGWVTERADASFSDRANRWDTLSMEAAAVGEWLGAATGAVLREILPRTWDFATNRGPLGPWLVATQRVRYETADRRVLWALCQLAYRAGDFETVRGAATEMARLAREAQDDRDWALAQGKIADVLAARGELNEALRIRREEELPVYERLGDVRARAITLGQIADVLAARGELDVALAMWRESLAVF
ncbi:MAG TPA: NB-ARC domain-containing protein, partial [Kofleriaceae bacterium]